MIEVKNLTKKYGNFEAVKNADFTINDGEVVGFLGPNGAGKSTTMNIITGYLSATSGSVSVNGYDIFEQPEEAKRHIGYLPEQPPLFPGMTVDEYLNFVYDLKKTKLPRNPHLAEIRKLVKIEDVKNRLIRNLSKGYRQRVGIAQALLGDPRYIILDEPTVGLDPLQIIEIRDLIHELGQTHTVILSSHILSEVQAICESVLIIAHGKLVAFDTPQNLESRLTSGGRLTLSADCSAEALHRILAAVPSVCDCRLLTTEEGRCKAQLEITGDAAEACKALFFAFAKAETAILQLTPEKADLENIFIELTDAQPDGKEPRHESDL